MVEENALAVVEEVLAVEEEGLDLDTLNLETIGADQIRSLLAAQGAVFGLILGHSLCLDKEAGGEVHVVMQNGAGLSAEPLRSRAFQDRILALGAVTLEAPPRPSDVKKAIQVVASLGPVLAERREIKVRVGGTPDEVWIDLGIADQPYVRVTKEGWGRHAESPVAFRRPQNFSPLPAPVPGGSVEELRGFINLERDSDWILLKAYLSAGLVPFGPHPILVLNGVQGSGKSVLCRMIRSLIDPHADALRTMPKSEQDLLIATQHNWLMAFDNVSEIKPAMSDSLCRLTTGAAFGSRKLYTNTDEVTIRARRPCLLNGIGDIVVAGDLLDRSLIVPMGEISVSERKQEHRVWKQFEEMRPRLLGALLDAVVQGMRSYDAIQLESMPRMADFAHWAVAAGPALGFNESDFLDAMLVNRRDADSVAVDSQPIGPVIVRLVENLGFWSGTCGSLLDLLDAMTANDVGRRQGSKWPRNATALGRQLRRIKPAIERLGVSIDFARDGTKKNERLVTLQGIEADPQN